MPESGAGWHLDVEQPVGAALQDQQLLPAKRNTEPPQDTASAAAIQGLFSTTLPTGSAPPRLTRLLEAMLFAAPAPITFEIAAECIRGLSSEQFEEALLTLQQEYRSQGKPYTVQRSGGAFRLALRTGFQHIVERLYGGVKEARLTAPMVETLAAVAYRQPVSKTDVDSLRGQDSGPMLRQLLRRGLIAVQARAEPADAEVRFVTPPRFLEFFQLAKLDDLPRVDDLPFL